MPAGPKHKTVRKPFYTSALQPDSPIQAAVFSLWRLGSGRIDSQIAPRMSLWGHSPPPSRPNAPQPRILSAGSAAAPKRLSASGSLPRADRGEPTPGPPGPTPSRVAPGLSSRLIYRRALIDQARRGASSRRDVLRQRRQGYDELGSRPVWVPSPRASLLATSARKLACMAIGTGHPSAGLGRQTPVRGAGFRVRGMAHEPKLRGARDRPMPRGLAPITTQHRPVQGPFASLADRTPGERRVGPVDKPSAP